MIKKHNLLPIFLLISSVLFSEDFSKSEESFSKLNNYEFPKIKDSELEKIKNKYLYFKVGATPFVGNIGFGQRNHDILECKGSDLAFNVHFCPFVLYSNQNCFYTSIKYSFLKYKKPLINSSYFGVGYELGSFLDFTDHGITLVPIPNIELVWGKELKSNHFSQFGINLVPAVAGLALVIADNGQGHFPGLERTIGIIAISGLSFSYTFGF